jgi:hypothetical protein
MVQRKVGSIRINLVSRRKGAMELLRSKIDLLEEAWALLLPKTDLCYFFLDAKILEARILKC